MAPKRVSGPSLRDRITDASSYGLSLLKRIAADCGKGPDPITKCLKNRKSAAAGGAFKGKYAWVDQAAAVASPPSAGGSLSWI